MAIVERLFATAVTGLSGYAGLSIMSGNIPGRGSDNDAFRGFAIWLAGLVETHGATFTGLGIFVLGTSIGLIAVATHKWEDRGVGGSDGGFWDGCDGDGGGD